MNIKELIKGIIIGVAKIIPGLSGAVLMISFNLYDKAIDAITNFFSNPKKNIFFLINLGLGIILGIVLFSNIIHFFITNYYVYTTSLFIGLILGGIPVIKNKITSNKSNLLIITISFFVMTILSISNINNNYVLKNNYIDTIVFFISGILEALGTVLPGISSTALLMLIGVYNNYIIMIKNALNPMLISETLFFILPFSLGLFLGIIVISLLVNFLFKHYYEKTFSLILGISFSSVTLLVIKLLPEIQNVFSLLICCTLTLLGFFLTHKL